MLFIFLRKYIQTRVRFILRINAKIKLFLISNKYNIIKNYILDLFSQVETNFIAKLKITIFEAPIVIFFQERRRAIADAFSVATLFLVFFKFFSIIITGFYPFIFINISLLFIIFLFSYYYELMIKIKTLIITYYYYNPYIIARDYLARFLSEDYENYELASDYLFSDLYFFPYENLKKYHFTQNLFFHFHVLLFQLRLIFLAEPYIFILFRMFILYLLIYNKLFFFAAIISIIGIFSRILFHMSFWDMTDVKNMYEFLSWEPLWLLKKNNNSIVLVPNRVNARIVYALSFLGIITNTGTRKEALTTWKMSTIYINNNKEIRKKYEDHHYEWQKKNQAEALERGWDPATLHNIKPYFGSLLTDYEYFIYIYLKKWGIKLNFPYYNLDEYLVYPRDEKIFMDILTNNAPDNFFTPNWDINYLIDGTYNKNQIFFFLLSFMFLLFSLGLFDMIFISNSNPDLFMEFGYKDTFITLAKKINKNLSTKKENIFINQGVRETTSINNIKYEDKVYTPRNNA